MMRRLIFGFILLLPLAGEVQGQDEALLKPPSRLLKIAALPERATGSGARFIDLNGDGNEDIVVSNEQGYGVYLFVPKEKEKPNLQWFQGWTLVMREGKAGDAHSLPIIRDGKVWFEKGALWSRGDKGVQQIPFPELLRVPGPAALSPEDSLRSMRMKPGFQAALVAHEPRVEDPVYIDWDEEGRMWVVEMGDYPFAPGEKTTNGKMGQGKVSARQTGRIKILEDVNGDGIYEKSTLFLDGLTHPTSLAPWRGGVFVASIPDLFYAKDTDGDGKCDSREVWFTGFTAGNPQHLVNGFAWGLDGWFYGANGDSGGEIKCLKSGQKIALGTHDFRFHPVTGELALEAGRSQFGKWRDDYGNWFGNNNAILGWHYWLPLRFLAEHPDITAKSMRSSLNDDKRVFPISPPVRRFNWASATQTLTSACSPMPYRDTALGESMKDVLFICEPANNLVHRQALDYSQTPITSRRHAEDAESEFIASTDNWFRPTQARMGPDGALYVVDMYRLVLEHPEWIPAEIAAGLDLRAGEDKGRIYRISKDGTRGRVSFADPVSQMSSSNGWVRDTAQRLLIERDAKEAAPAMLALGASDASVAVRIQALFTAKALGGITSDQLLGLLRPMKPQVRGAALLSTGASAKDILPENELANLKLQTQPAPKGKTETVPVITHNDPDRQKIVVRYTQEVARLRADGSRGQAVFQKACIACHKTRGIGVEVGPDLSTVASKPAEQLIEAIFDPNRAVEQRNAATQVTQKDGVVILGLLITETPNSITLKMPGGADIVVPRSSIREMKTHTTSLMLVGLESVVTPQECADLLAWIRAGQ